MSAIVSPPTPRCAHAEEGAAGEGAGAAVFRGGAQRNGEHLTSGGP